MDYAPPLLTVSMEPPNQNQKKQNKKNTKNTPKIQKTNKKTTTKNCSCLKHEHLSVRV